MSIDYELAQELKEAGFPQSNKQGAWWFDEHKTLFVQATTYGVDEVNRTSECVRVPTLEELIEACPEEIDDHCFSFACLTFHKSGKWLAGYEKYEKFTPECCGSTAIEAVARLWLALYKKAHG